MAQLSPSLQPGNNTLALQVEISTWCSVLPTGTQDEHLGLGADSGITGQEQARKSSAQAV